MTGLQEQLESWGFQLTDRGLFWQANAAYRNGDNKTAVQIYKDSGVWRDFVEGTQPRPFVDLVERMTGKKSLSGTLLVDGADVDYEKEESLAVGKTFPDSILDRLLPNYIFYTKKGISQQVLEYYRCGLATNGKMYQRLVFPVFNDAGQIIGFAGRDMMDSPERPKWKILGQKKQFKYPFNIPTKSGKFPFRNKILNADTVVLIESVGDSLALSEAGITNHLVCFGVAISPAVLSCLTASNCQRILICFNNDKYDNDDNLKEGGENVGLQMAEKAKAVLNRYFYDREIIICELPKKDFGRMNTSEIKKFYDSQANPDPT